jgi:hypothetical protein
MHRPKTNFVDDANAPLFFLERERETPIPTELKGRLFRNIGFLRYNESKCLTKRNTRQNILTLDNYGEMRQSFDSGYLERTTLTSFLPRLQTQTVPHLSQ